MPKNEFLSFGIEPGANVLGPDAYNLLAARKQGFFSGVAKSEELNTVWRQASVIAATFAQYIAERTGKDVLDDGDMAALLTLTKEALNAVQSVTAGDNTHEPDEHGDVKLGSAADKNVTVSARDATTDHVLKTADYGIGRTIGTVTTGIDFKSFVFIQGEHLFVKMDTCTNIPAELNATTYYYIFVKGMRDSDGSPCIELVKYDNPSEVWNAYGAGAAGARTWTLYRSYNSGYKQTAADTGAMPYFGTALSVDLNTLGAYSAAGVHYQTQNAGATTANHYPVAEAGALLVLPSAYGCQQEYTTFGTGRKFLRGLSGPWNGTNGPWGNWNELYGPTNPNEIVSSSANSFRSVYGNYGAFWRQDGTRYYLMLTNSGDQRGSYNALRPFYVDLATGYPVMSRLNLTDWTYFDARYLSANSTLTRLGAQVVVNVPNNATVSAPAGCVSSAIKCGNSGALTGLGYRPLQILVNGTWVNVQSL